MSEGQHTFVVNDSLAIPLAELHWQFTASGGPGGQHANTSNTKVELRWSVSRSRVLDDDQRELLVRSVGDTVVVVVSEERSQHRNREIALERLRDRVARALVEETPRVPTRIPRSAVRKRLADKRRLSERKQERKPETGLDL